MHNRSKVMIGLGLAAALIGLQTPQQNTAEAGVKAEQSASANKTAPQPGKNVERADVKAILRGGFRRRTGKRNFRSAKACSVPEQKRRSRKARNIQRHKARA